MKKQCRTCGSVKDRSEFPSSGWNVRKDGSRLRILKADCKVCHNQKVVENYQQMLQSAGVVFKCVRCGYDKCKSSIDFHHRDPSEKDFTLASRVSISKQKFLNEVQKCVLLCKNCHAELHNGLWMIEELGGLG